MIVRAEDQNQLQLVEREDIDDEEDLFEAIDKCKLQNLRSRFIWQFFWYRFLLVKSIFVSAWKIFSYLLNYFGEYEFSLKPTKPKSAKQFCYSCAVPFVRS